MNDYKFLIYDIEVFKYDWIVVLKDLNAVDNNIFVVHNDRKALIDILSKYEILIGYNNHYYDDYILYYLLKENYDNIKLYNLSVDLIKGVKNKLNLSNVLTLDCMQELRKGVSLKSIECSLGLSIEESPIPFNIDRNLNDMEISKTVSYCIHDVNTTERVFKLRSDYFTAKFDIINSFNLPLEYIKKTRSFLVSKVLNASSVNRKEKDRLLINFIDKINWSNIPTELKDFYFNIVKDFKNGVDYELLENKSLTLEIQGVEHTYGFGGVHGGKNNFTYKGDMLYLDFSSFYPSLMIKYDFLSRNCESKQDFINLYDTRFKLKREKNSMEYIYKILLNATYGATKDKYNAMYDPVQANNICINGQLIMTDLIVRLSKYSTIIQTNTDGVIVAYDKKDYEKIKNILKDIENNYNLTIGEDAVEEIYQRDVNNYIMKLKNGKIKGTRRFKNWNYEKINFEYNNLSIIDIGLKQYYIDGISPIDTVNELLDNKIYLPFQLISKTSSKYDYLCIYNCYSNKYEKLKNKVNRVFATKNILYGSVFKVKGEEYSKHPYSPKHSVIINKKIINIPSINIDREYYANLIKSFMLDNKKIKRVSNVNFKRYSLFEI